MDQELEKVCVAGFSFFGMASRLVSHELKNILAIISETSGLMDELVELSGEGRKLEPGKLRSLTESMLEEVERANTLIRTLNTFGHSVDRIIQDVDVNKTLSFMIQLAGLDARSKKTALRFSEIDVPPIVTSPFFLESLLYHTIDFLFGVAGPDDEIRISLHAEKGKLGIRFSGIASKGIHEFPTKSIAMLVKTLSGEISPNTTIDGFEITLPERIGESLIRNLSQNE